MREVLGASSHAFGASKYGCLRGFIALLVCESFLAHLLQGPESQKRGLKAEGPRETSGRRELRLW